MNGSEDPTTPVWDRLPAPLAGVGAFAAGLALTGATTLACLAISPWLPAHAIAMLYLLAVVGSAVVFGLQGGLWAAASAFLAYNFFFLAPFRTLSISDPRDVVALVVFLAVAAAAGSLAGRLRELAERARSRAYALQRLNALAARLTGASSFSAVAGILAQEAAQAISGVAVVMAAGGDGLDVEAQSSSGVALTTADWSAAQRSLLTRQSVFPAAAGWSGPTYVFHPLVVRDSGVAVLGVQAAAASENDGDATLRAMVNHAAIALERLSLEAETARVQKEAETERLRASLLSSVSHDIKTPLASIQGAVTSLRELGAKMPEESKADLLATIEEETERLLRFVTNLLDMTRLQLGGPDIGKDWVDLRDIVSASVARARRLLPEAQISVETTEAAALVKGNETLLEHVLLNLIENAANHASSNTPIRVKLAAMAGAYVVTVEDDGAGIAADDLPRVFDKFFRGAGASARGSGLGLTIAREVMHALGGTILAESPIVSGRGTRIALRFPIRDDARAANGETA